MSQVWWRAKAAKAAHAAVRLVQPSRMPGGCLSPEVLEVCEALGIRPYMGVNNRAIDSTKVQGQMRSVLRQPTFVEHEKDEPVLGMPNPQRKFG